MDSYCMLNIVAGVQRKLDMANQVREVVSLIYRFDFLLIMLVTHLTKAIIFTNNSF